MPSWYFQFQTIQISCGLAVCGVHTPIPRHPTDPDETTVKAELNPLNNQNWLISLLDTFSNA